MGRGIRKGNTDHEHSRVIHCAYSHGKNVTCWTCTTYKLGNLRHRYVHMTPARAVIYIIYIYKIYMYTFTLLNIGNIYICIIPIYTKAKVPSQ